MRKRMQAAAEMAKKRSSSDELLNAVEAAAAQVAAEHAALPAPTKAQLHAATLQQQAPGEPAVVGILT